MAIVEFLYDNDPIDYMKRHKLIDVITNSPKQLNIYMILYLNGLQMIM